MLLLNAFNNRNWGSFAINFGFPELLHLLKLVKK
jgi:hypothetical protein